MILALLRDLNDKGTTIFLTTHNMEEANRLCHRVGIIRAGTMAAIDAPEKLKTAIDRVHKIEVSFDREVPADALAGLAGVTSADRTGDKWQITAENRDAVIRSLVEFSRQQGATIVTLNTLARSDVARVDGLRSVAAAFTLEEAGALAAKAGLQGASVRRCWPQRFALSWRRPRSDLAPARRPGEPSSPGRTTTTSRCPVVWRSCFLRTAGPWANGIRRAMGRPDLAMMISSPAPAWSASLERWVLAS